MASVKASHATGAAQGEQDLRRRNVPSDYDGNGQIPDSVEPIDDKKSRQVRTFYNGLYRCPLAVSMT